MSITGSGNPPTASSNPSRAGWIFRSSSLVLLLSMATIALGLLVQIVLAAALGTGREMDAFLVAITLPTFLSVVSMGASISSLVPFFKEQQSSPDPRSMATASAGIFTVFLLASFGLVTAIFLGADPIVRVMAPGLDESTMRLAAGLLRIMIFGSLFDIPRGFLTAYFISRERFFPSQFVPILNHCFLLIGLLFLFHTAGLYAVAWAWVGGSAAMFVPLAVLFLRREGFHIAGGALNPPLGRAWTLLVPALIVVVFQQATPFLDRLAASFLAPGAISFLGYGSKILEILLRTVPLSIGIVAFPLLSRQALEKDFTALRDLSLLGMRWILLGTMPMAIYVFAVRQPFIEILFRHGNFNFASVQSVAGVLAWYAFALIPAAILSLLTNIGFAIHRPWVIAGWTAAGLCATLGLNLLFSHFFGPSGIAMSYLVVTSVLTLGLIVSFQKTQHLPLLLLDRKWLGKFMLASILCLGAVLAAGRWFSFPAQGFVASAIRLLLDGLLVVAVYGSVLFITGLPEIRTLGRRVFGK
jgi:putative peptidoglycan lipid II flippase